MTIRCHQNLSLRTTEKSTRMAANIKANCDAAYNSPSLIMSENGRRDISKHDDVRQVRHSRCMDLFWVNRFRLLRSCGCCCGRKIFSIQPTCFHDWCPIITQARHPNEHKATQQKSNNLPPAQCISIAPL